jgi:hypothetical protein
MASEHVHVCWNVQPDTFRIELGKDKTAQLEGLISKKNEEFKYVDTMNIQNKASNAIIQVFETGDASENTPITPPQKAVVAKSPSGSLVLYINADKGGLRPEKGSLSGATPLTIFQKTLSTRSTGKTLPPTDKFKTFDSEKDYEKFIEESKSSKYDPKLGKHTLSEDTFTDAAKQFISGKDAWNKGIFLSVWDVVSTFPQGFCDDQGNLKKTLEKNAFFVHEHPHCVFFNVSVEKNNEGIIHLNFVIDKPASKKCTTKISQKPPPVQDHRKVNAAIQQPKAKQPPAVTPIENPPAPAPKPSKGSASGARPPPPHQEITDVDGAASAIMNQLKNAYRTFKTAHPSDKDNAALTKLLEGTDDYPKLEQREAYTIQANAALWESIKNYLKQNDGHSKSLKQIYDIFDGKEWFEEDAAAANLRNILNACISLWKFRSLNPPKPADAAA